MMNKTDLELKADVENELRWDPAVNSAQIGVSVDKGAVSLLGIVDTFPQMWAAEDAVKRVGGVRTIAQDLTVKILGGHQRSDMEIATAVETAFRWDVYVPATVTATVHQGTVTLGGTSASKFERAAANQAVRHLAGVVSVFDGIEIKPTATAVGVKEQVMAALQRQETQDESSIHVEVSGGNVTLTGTASSWQAIKNATHAAWAAPGVTSVDDQLTFTTPTH